MDCEQYIPWTVNNMFRGLWTICLIVLQDSIVVMACTIIQRELESIDNQIVTYTDFPEIPFLLVAINYVLLFKSDVMLKHNKCY